MVTMSDAQHAWEPDRARVITITPALARAAARGRDNIPDQRYTGGTPSGRRAHWRDLYLRTLMARLARALRDSDIPSDDTLIGRVPVPPCFLDGGREEESLRAIARASLTRYRAVLRIQAFACIVGVTCDIRTPVLTMGAPDRSVIFRGRLDLVALRADGSLACIAFTPPGLHAGANTEITAAAAVYDRLVRAACGAHETAVDVLQIHLPTWQLVCTRLTDRQAAATAGITLHRMIEAMPERDPRRPTIGRGAMGRFPNRTTPPRRPTSDGAYDVVATIPGGPGQSRPSCAWLGEGVG